MMHTDFFPTKHKIFLKQISVPIFSMSVVIMQHSKKRSDRETRNFVWLFLEKNKAKLKIHV